MGQLYQKNILLHNLPNKADLYREACTLLFFRYGITPTAAKLYQYVRKGSMSAPAQALAQFWEALRSKARVDIDHPDLPPALKTTAAQAIADIWRQATAAARAEMAAMRIEVQAELERARHDQQSAREAAEQAHASADALRAQLATEQNDKAQAQTELQAERHAHAAATVKIQALQNQAWFKTAGFWVTHSSSFYLLKLHVICNPGLNHAGSSRYWTSWKQLRGKLKHRFHRVLDAVTQAMGSTPRCSSLVENLNSRLRTYFTLRRHLGDAYLSLLQFFLNHRRFMRSRVGRQDHSPRELMTGQKHPHWLTMLGLGEPCAPQA